MRLLAGYCFVLSAAHIFTDMKTELPMAFWWFGFISSSTYLAVMFAPVNKPKI